MHVDMQVICIPAMESTPGFSIKTTADQLWSTEKLTNRN